MIDQDRTGHGWFAKKGNSIRNVRTIRLTDETWNLLGEKADENDMSKADFLELLASGEVDWSEGKEVELELDFDVDEVGEKLKEILSLKSRDGTKMKEIAKKIAEIMEIELEDE